ncbi:urea ABC transporter permease subunit UrtB [Parasalinivibrio latis]
MTIKTPTQSREEYSGFVHVLVRTILPVLLVLSAFPVLAVSTLSDVESALSGRDFNKKAQAVDWLATSGHEKAKPALQGLLDRKITYHKKAKTLWTVAEGRATHLFTGESVAVKKKRDYRNVTINNALRSQIRTVLATLDLRSPDEAVRLAAVEGLIGTTDTEILQLFSGLLKHETVPSIRRSIDVALAIGILQGERSIETSDKLTAIALLTDAGHPKAMQALQKALQKVTEPQAVRAIERGLDKYDQTQRVNTAVETLYFGLSLGSVLVLAGIGLAITFGVMGVINMAHGELIMLGAYTTYVMQLLLPESTGVALLLSIPAAFVVSGLVGIAIERGVIRFLYGRPLETLLATFGISLILQQAVRSIFSPLNRSVATPDFMSGMLEITPMLSLTWNRLYIIFFCLMVFLALVFVLKKTPLGLQVRAVSQNRAMARAMGVRSEWVDAMTFGLGSGVAGVAGVALSQLTNVGPNMGQAYIIDSFMVVVFGGVGNLWGTMVAGLSLGLFNKILEPWAGAVLAKILVLVFIILFIQKRPRGLFPQRGRAVEG